MNSMAAGQAPCAAGAAGGLFLCRHGHARRPDGEGFEADPLGRATASKGQQDVDQLGDHELAENIDAPGAGQRFQGQTAN